MIEVALAVVFGLLIGSFLNVCIARLPWDYSVVIPRSHCPHCGTFLAWFENVPVLSWLVLRARCRTCGAPISWRYPFVELLTAFCFGWAVHQSGATWAGLRLCVFAALLIGLVFTDLDWRILPDEFTIAGLGAGLVLAAIEPLPPGLLSFFYPNASPRLLSLIEAAVGAFLVSGILWSVGALYARVRGREGLGLGDVKMLAMIGAFLGLESTLLVLVVGSALGSVIGLIWIKLRKLDPATYEMPFGSFLGAAALLVALFGQGLLAL
jgi:leader peptidase (prepilin peptidase) / N-methyltransferase